jgi:hypothetical protein
MSRPRGAAQLVCIAGLMGLPLAQAWAAPATYVCEDKQVLKVTATPLTVHVAVGDEQWVARRVRDAREAYFLNRAKGVQVFIKHSDMTLRRPAGDLHCKLLPQSMAPENFYVAPAK